MIRLAPVSKISLNRRRTLYSGLIAGDLLKEGLQRLLLLGTQTLGIAAEGPHLGPKGFSWSLVSFALYSRVIFFRKLSTTSLNFLATWNRSVTARLWGNLSGMLPDKPAPC